jgi:mannose-6-phosphate isomerase-like protein (cupin superfamily)
MSDAVRLGDKLALFQERWSPKIVAELNGHHVKLAKLEGAFDFHHHDDTDELFYVLHGRLRVEYRDREAIWLHAGDLLVVPRGVEHRPVAPEETHVMLVEQAGTINAGNVEREGATEGEWI